MSEAGNNEQIDEDLDADILQSKRDVLRAHDIIPGTAERNKERSGNLPAYEGQTHQAANPQKTDENTTEAAKQKKADIPRFDLAEKIMAEQRKITAVKRKAPGEKVEPQKQAPMVESISHTIEQPMPAQSEQDRIIAEIVARDIERLCRGDYLAGR